MDSANINALTKPAGRKLLYHFTRASNLPSIAFHDALQSAASLDPAYTDVRRTAAKIVNAGMFDVTLNAHLRIPDSMLEAGVTQELFRTCLDRHVFMWPTLTDCRKMVDMYSRREPNESFAVLAFDACSLLTDHYAAVKLSKYDSGSAPRFPVSCSYRKSPDMFLPVSEFKRTKSKLVPVLPSEIREVLIEGRVDRISGYLRAIYVDRPERVPDSWRRLVKPLAELRR